MSEVGSTLKKKRDELGLSLSEASLHTKISPKVLTAIENGDKKALPALPFAKGFIRSYAQYLKLDGDKILSDFLQEIGDASEISEVHAKIDNAVSNAVDVTDDEGVGTRVLLIGGVILLIGLIVGLKSLIDKYQREAQVVDQVEVTATPIDEAQGVIVPKEAEEKEAKIVESEAKEIEEKAEEVKAESTPEEKVEVVAPVAPPPSKEESKTEEVKKEEPKKVETPVKVVEPEPIKVEEPASGAPQEVILEALDNTTVTATIGKGSPKQLKLQAGQIHVIRGKDAIHLSFSDGGAVNVTHNGRNKGVPGALGQAKKVNYP